MPALSAGRAHAHPAPFSYLDLRLAPDGLTGSLTVHDLDAAFELKITDADALLDPAVARRHGPALAAILAPRLHLRVDGREVVVTLSDAEPVPDRQGLRFALGTEGSTAPGRVDVETTLFPTTPTTRPSSTCTRARLRHQAILDAGHDFAYFTGTWQGALRCSHLRPGRGQHILIGPDHLLFLVGLLLLGGSLRQLAWS